MRHTLRHTEHFSDNESSHVFGLFGDVFIGLIGACFGLVYGDVALSSIGIVPDGLWTLFLTGGLGALGFLFIANFIHVVAGPAK